jgi:hypothetical protein
MFCVVQILLNSPEHNSAWRSAVSKAASFRTHLQYDKIPDVRWLFFTGYFWTALGTVYWGYWWNKVSMIIMCFHILTSQCVAVYINCA